MTTYDVGDLATLSTTVADTSGTLTDATVALSVTAPDGTNPSVSVSHGGTGLYSATVSISQAGTWFYKWSVTGAVQAVESGQFSAADPAPPTYATLAQLKSHLTITDTVDDDILLRALQAASRAIDVATSRRFWLAPTATARIYNPVNRFVWGPEGQRIVVDDFGSTSGLVVEKGTAGGASWTAFTGYEVWPDAALDRGWPCDSLLQVLGWVIDRTTRIRVTARWGFPAVPDPVVEATLLLGGRYYRRRQSVDGVSSMGEWGSIRIMRNDPDIGYLLNLYARPLVA